MTNLGGEQRFAAAVARRLQSLGALTRGDRRAASGVDLSESNFDSPLGRKSLRQALLSWTMMSTWLLQETLWAATHVLLRLIGICTLQSVYRAADSLSVQQGNVTAVP